MFQTSVPNINMHLKNIFGEGELDPKATIKDFLIVRFEGSREVNRKIEYYNLDAIISVGYRIKSHVATSFRIWATQRIKEYIVKGFVLDDERLKNPDIPFDYFEELPRRVQRNQTCLKKKKAHRNNEKPTYLLPDLFWRPDGSFKSFFSSTRIPFIK